MWAAPFPADLDLMADSPVSRRNKVTSDFSAAEPREISLAYRFPVI